MMNSSAKNHLMSPSHENHAPPFIKNYFKTPEGKYKLQFDKTFPTAFPHYTQTKTVTQVTVAHLSDKPIQMQGTNSQPVTSLGVSSGVRSAAARFLSGGNGSKAHSFVGGNGGNKPLLGGDSTIPSSLVNGSGFDGKGSYLVFNVGDAIFISDLNSDDKDPIKPISFSSSNPVCHAFDPDAKDGHDLIIGMSSGDVYSVSLRQQLQDVGKKLVGAQHYNKDSVVNSSRCTCIAWIPNSDGSFIVAHVDGNMYVYEKNKDGSGDPLFPVIKDQTQFSVSHARYSKNPVARWHVCQGSINAIAFSTDGAYLATVGRDGYLRVFDYASEQLICGGKSYYGGLLCCAWSMDGKYVLTGGEDDLVQVWSIEQRKIIAWCEGHNSWVSGVAFDSYWSAPNADGLEENVVYRFGSVGQDTQMLLWDLELDELVVPVRRAPGGSPTFSMGSPSAHWDSALPTGSLQPAPSTRDVPKLSPLVVHRVHDEPLSGLIFTQESVLTICREGHIKIWTRPGSSVSQSSNDADSVSSTNFKEKCTMSGRAVGSGFKQKNDMVTSTAAMING